MARTGLTLALTAFAMLTAAPAPAALGENLIQQWTFDEGINGWDNLAGKLWEQQDDCRPLPEQPNPGSLEMLATDYVSQCVGIVGDQGYSIQVHFKTMLTGDAFGKAGISVVWHSDAFCHTYLEGPYIHPFSYSFGATDWEKIELAAGAPLAAHSALVYLGAEKTAGSEGSEMRVRFDDVILAPIYNGVSTTTTTEAETTTTTDTVTTTTDEIGAPGCADPVLPYDTVTVADALYILRRSVGLVACQTCLCDTDQSGTMTTSDALRALRIAVGQSVTKRCGACEA